MQYFRDITYNVLRKAGKPMHISDLTIQVNKIRRIESNTPKNTINVACQRHHKIERVERGIFRAVK